MPKRVEHTGRPDCMTCDTAVGLAGAQAFRAARALARKHHTRPHVFGETPVADAACAAADAAEAATWSCYRDTV